MKKRVLWAVLWAFFVIAAVSVSAMSAKGATKRYPNFRAKFYNETVESRIHEFEYWNEIQSKEIDTAFETYQKGSYIQKEYPKEAALIFKLIEQGGLLGVVAEAHEKWEVIEYLRKGYSLEDIGGGKAYEEYKPVAHAEARFKECRLYQFWYKQLFGDNPPAMKAFLFVHPVLKIIVQDVYKVEVTTEIMDMLVREIGKDGSAARSEKCSEEDVVRALKFFEKTGYSYGDGRDLFLKRGLIFLKEIK